MKQLNESLIPESGKKEAEGGNYFCTWCTQSAMLDPSSGGNDKAAAMRDMLTEQFLFSESDGILTDDRMLPVRGDLTVVLDDGWDVPPGTENPSHSNRFGSLHIALEKFPFLQAAGSPEEALKEMNERMLSLGYRGTGVWVSPQIPWPDGSLSPKRSMSEFRKHWEDCAALCDRAGIRYWKVDWGNCGSAEHRKIITEALRESAPGIRIEHALVQNPLTPENPDFLKDRLEYLAEILPFSDFLRTYDIVKEFETVTTLFRCMEAFHAAEQCFGKPQQSENGAVIPADGGCILNVEDEPYIAASLGCANGVMRHRAEHPSRTAEWERRHPFWKEKGLGHLRKQLTLDESFRSLRFQRIAPPFPLAGSDNRCAEKMLSDTHSFHQDSWPFLRGPYTESAPAVLTRNCDFPEILSPVFSEEERPFLTAMRHPNGVLALAALPRFRNGIRSIPKVRIRMETKRMDFTAGLFGDFDAVIFALPETLPEGKRILMQDLIGERAFDVSSEISCEGKLLSVPGDLIRKVGLSSATPGDFSRAGALLSLR